MLDAHSMLHSEHTRSLSRRQCFRRLCLHLYCPHPYSPLTVTSYSNDLYPTCHAFPCPPGHVIRPSGNEKFLAQMLETLVPLQLTFDTGKWEHLSTSHCPRAWKGTGSLNELSTSPGNWSRSLFGLLQPIICHNLWKKQKAPMGCRNMPEIETFFSSILQPAIPRKICKDAKQLSSPSINLAYPLFSRSHIPRDLVWNRCLKWFKHLLYIYNKISTAR